MKRRDLIKLLESKGARLKRNGGNHDVYELNNKTTTVPRHKEVNDYLVKVILKQLGLKP
ncbi:type II toxin-antitoxin system HicA family toxin [Helcococcus kunzii]|uniref:type II toxin-antitoxin system HicA family toxin n=1 Tax=Helcococcus kunzii TaxID=40091 RepID=UPI001BAF6D1C|nr:type II toxin-antitoxin system HicA family toxin [Helcococcus kunzii]QUY64303.1 type II toxin-antitoxin system HicA family toxin [Helcococcus kunzii]